VIVLGDARVGKTSLLAQHRRKEFVTRYRPTIGADFTTSTSKVDGTVTTLQLWDTAGDPRYVSDEQSFCRRAEACMLVFDITRRESFDGINRHKEAFLANAGLSPGQLTEVRWVLVGNKADSANARAVTKKRACEWCGAHGGMPYVETSAKTAEGVRAAFETLVRCPEPTAKAGAARTFGPGFLGTMRRVLGRAWSASGSSGKLKRMSSDVKTLDDATGDVLLQAGNSTPELGLSRSDSSSGRLEGGWATPAAAAQVDTYPGLSAL